MFVFRVIKYSEELRWLILGTRRYSHMAGSARYYAKALKESAAMFEEEIDRLTLMERNVRRPKVDTDREGTLYEGSMALIWQRAG